MKMTEARYQEHVDDNAGFCTHCQKVTMSDVEPDADGYDCPECSNPNVMGIENALVYEHIEVTPNDDEEEDEYGFISLSEDEGDDEEN